MAFSLRRGIPVLLLGLQSLANGLSVDVNCDGSLTVSQGEKQVNIDYTASGAAGLGVKSMGDSSMVTSNGASVKWTSISDDILAIDIRPGDPEDDDYAYWPGSWFNFADAPENLSFYGVWEYPFNGTIDNKEMEFQIKGLIGDQVGVNYANARAPFFFTSHGWGIYADESAMGTFSFFSHNKTARFEFESDDWIRHYVIVKENLKDLISYYGELSNTISMPPDSGYGPIFWSDNMMEDFHGDVSNSEENYYDIADHLYDSQIRASAMFADRPYGTGNMSFGNFDFDPEYFPSPIEFIENLSAYGYDFQVWVANRAFLNTQLFNDSAAQDWLFPGIDPETFLGPALNLSIPAAYDYFLEKLSVFPKMGVKGYKIDRGEELEMPDSEQNIQNILFDELCYKSMVDYWGEGNFFTFTRSAFDRSRSQVAIWNGDPQATFEGLQYSVASGIRSGLIGFSTWGSDIGGYLRGDDANKPTEELWARWMQFGIFSPMYEIMVGTGHTPWYEPYTDRLVDILKQSADMHTKLIPFIKSYTYEATQTNIPVMRALFLEYPADEFAYTASDMYAFGEEFLIAPFVTEGGEREVMFPTGYKFLEYHNKTTVYEGGMTETISLDLEYSPVYVREGSIVPTGDIHRGNAMWVEDWEPFLEIEVFPSFNVGMTTFAYYREDGMVANITLTTDQEAMTAFVDVDELGVKASVLVYHKEGVVAVPLPGLGEAAGVLVENFESLFD